MCIGFSKYPPEKTMRNILKYLPLIAVSLSGNLAQAITIDGKPGDWGLHQNGNAADWKPDPVLVPSKEQYLVEDQTGGASSRLNPGWGGQAYDAEALYVSLDDYYIYLALVTGLSPKTPDKPSANSYGPGDFAIDFGQDGSYEFGIETTGNNGNIAGAVYKVSTWGYGLWDAQGNYNPAHPDLTHPTSILAGKLVDFGKLSYPDTPIAKMGAHKNDAHYVIEAAIPLSAFQGYGGKFDVHWTMNCANDSIQADPKIEMQISSVPEPGTLALLPLGLAGLVFLRRRQSA
jgi:hypothetical protein